MAGAAPIYGFLGALAAFPRRLAAREIARQGGALRSAAARDVTHLVVGRKLLDRTPAESIAARVRSARSSGALLLSENGFRRQLGVLQPAGEAAVSRQSLADQSKLDGATLDLLALFDCFERDSEPFSFRDVILARKYQKLIAAGTGWADIARSVHRAGAVTSLTAFALHGEGKAVYLKDGERLAEIDGQGLLPFDENEEAADPDALFEEAEAAEHEGDYAHAAALYGTYLALVPGDPVAAFNRANALRAAGQQEEAAVAYAVALKLDPGFAEAWFNFGSLLRDSDKPDLARSHFEHAIALDGSYADPVYNLAALEYDTGRLAEARRWWARYLELDPASEWGRKAERGIRLVDMTLAAERKRGA